MLKRSLWVLAALTGLLATSCAPSIYLPQATHAPLFEGKGDFQAQIGTGTAGAYGQAAYAITDNVGLTANVARASSSADSAGGNFRKHLQGDIAGVYYHNFMAYSCVELMAGVGAGEMRALRFNSNAYPGSMKNAELFEADINYTRLFLQTDIGSRNHPFFGSNDVMYDAGISLRITKPLYQRWNYFQTIYNPVSGIEPRDRQLLEKPTFRTTIFEPSLFYRLGTDKVKGYIQGGFYFGPGTGAVAFGNYISFNIGLQLALDFYDYDKEKNTPSPADEFGMLRRR